MAQVFLAVQQDMPHRLRFSTFTKRRDLIANLKILWKIIKQELENLLFTCVDIVGIAFFILLCYCCNQYNFIRHFFNFIRHIWFVWYKLFNEKSGYFPLTDMQTPLPSEVVETLWKMRNVLNRMGKIIKKFSEFYFSSYREIS